MNRNLVGLFLLLASLSGCSLTAVDKTDLNPIIGEINLYLQRGSMNESNFEQYSLVDDKIYFECGVVSGGRSRVRDRDTTEAGDLRFRIARDVMRLNEIALKGSANFPTPGSGAGLFDGGRIELRIEDKNQPLKITTTLDKVVNGETTRFKALKRISENFRDQAGGEICGRSEFYGLQ